MGFSSKRLSQFFGSALIVFQFFCSTSSAPSRGTQNGGRSASVSNVQVQQKLDRLRKLGSTYLQKKEWQSASATFDEALAIRPDDPQSLYGKALALFNLQQIPA